ncbi:MAG: ferredoxin, partial [Halioglobus sp.]
ARIYAEEFGPASLRRHNAHENDDVTSPAATEAIVEFTHSQVEEAWSTSDGNLLNFAEAHGFTPEFGCRSGQCGACKTKILSGAVHYATKPSSPLEADEALLCCAVPAAGPDNEIAKLSLEL